RAASAWGALVLAGVPPPSRRAEFLLRGGSVALYGSAGTLAAPVLVGAEGRSRQSRWPGAGARPGLRGPLRRGVGTGRALVGKRDVPGDTMRRPPLSPPAVAALLPAR